MRMAGAVTLGVLIIEALLAGAYALGFYWLGAWHWGMLFAGALLLLIALPWAGELKLVFDSAGPRGAVKVGWWGRASFVKGASATHVVVRVLGIPIRRRMEDRKKDESESPEVKETPEVEPAAAEDEPIEDVAAEPEAKEATIRKKPIWERVDSETIEGFCRVIGSALGATCELVWGAEEIRVSVQDPAENEIADRALEQVFGRRAIGPADVTISSGPCERRVRAIYRIGLLRAALAGLQVVIDGRVPQFAKRMKQQKKTREVVDEDQRIIDQIVEQSEWQEDED